MSVQDTESCFSSALVSVVLTRVRGGGQKRNYGLNHTLQQSNQMKGHLEKSSEWVYLK